MDTNHIDYEHLDGAVPIDDVFKPEDSAAALEPEQRQNGEFDLDTLDSLMEITSDAAQGNIEVRMLHCDPSTQLGAFGLSINHLLDMTDAFLREAGAAMEHASDDKFFRKVLLRGMRGTFRDKAESPTRNTMRGCSMPAARLAPAIPGALRQLRKSSSIAIRCSALAASRACSSSGKASA